MNIFLLLLMLTAWAQADTQERVLAGYDPKTDIISPKYEAGPFLIYDCEAGHWVCVLRPYFEECQQQRKEDLAKDLRSHARCAPFGEFPTKKSCFQRQLFLVSNNHSTRACLINRWKQKEVEF